MMSDKWKLEGYDHFVGGEPWGESYPLVGEYDSKAEAEKAALARLAKLEIEQPSNQSGGQNGIQDQVFIVSPDGSTYRYLPS